MFVLLSTTPTCGKKADSRCPFFETACVPAETDNVLIDAVPRYAVAYWFL